MALGGGKGVTEGHRDQFRLGFQLPDPFSENDSLGQISPFSETSLEDQTVLTSALLSWQFPGITLVEFWALFLANCTAFIPRNYMKLKEGVVLFLSLTLRIKLAARHVNYGNKGANEVHFLQRLTQHGFITQIGCICRDVP
jgi:hypothetical protein